MQTIALSFREIAEGEEPWIALGNFMNDFFGNYPDQREELLREPVQKLVNATQEHWASFCAASVEYLSERYGLQCPAWVQKPEYTLSEP